MDTQERIARQRVQHIVDSYRLDGEDVQAFAAHLAQLLDIYPYPLVELALTESIVKGWLEVPMQRGMPFIQGVHERLRFWQPDLDGADPSTNNALKSHQPGLWVEAPLDIKTAMPTALESPQIIDTLLTPGQFEQITGLDASLVFDESGKVHVTSPMSTIKPLEPRS